jgi:hypothetical protein
MKNGYVHLIVFGLSIRADDENLFRLLEEAELDRLLENICN